MNASLLSCCARQTRYGGSRVFLPARSVTRLQRSTSLPHYSPILRTVGASRSFSWNPFGGASKTPLPAQPPAPEFTTSTTQVAEENLAATTQATSISPESPVSVLSDVSTTVDAGASEMFTDSISSTAATLAAHPLPIQYGDMAALGLVSWTPPGLSVWILEAVQVSTGLPWWSVIALTTVGARVVLFPFIIELQRFQAKMAPLQSKLAEIRKRATKAKADGDAFASQQALQENMVLYKTHDINPIGSLIPVVAQATVQFGLFLGIRKMCLVPVEQLKVGGLGWITDLTALDPLYILPLINIVFVNAQLRIGRRDALAVGNPTTPHIFNFIHIASPLMGIVAIYLPAALNLHIIVSLLCISLQTVVLHTPAVRRMLSLPPLPPPAHDASIKDTFEAIRGWFRKQVEEARKKEEERQRKIRRAQKQFPR